VLRTPGGSRCSTIEAPVGPSRANAVLRLRPRARWRVGIRPSCASAMFLARRHDASEQRARVDGAGKDAMRPAPAPVSSRTMLSVTISHGLRQRPRN